MKWTHSDQLLLDAVREDLPAILDEAKASLLQSQAEDANSGTARLTETTPLTFNVGPRPEKESSIMTQTNTFLNDLTTKTTEAKRIAQIANPLVQDYVRESVRADHDARIAAKIQERADTAGRLPGVLQECEARGDGLSFRESDADFRTRWNDGLRLSEQREQDRQTAKGIASSIATLGT